MVDLSLDSSSQIGQTSFSVKLPQIGQAWIDDFRLATASANSFKSSSSISSIAKANLSALFLPTLGSLFNDSSSLTKAFSFSIRNQTRLFVR